MLVSLYNNKNKQEFNILFRMVLVKLFSRLILIFEYRWSIFIVPFPIMLYLCKKTNTINIKY